MEIGFIGLGHMGFPMVSNLLANGYAVRVYDTSDAAVAKAVEQGAMAAQSLIDLAQSADAIAQLE